MENDRTDEQTQRLGGRTLRMSNGTPPPRRKGWRRVRRILLIVALFIVLLAGAGLLYQSIASAQDASSYPPSGKLIDVGGYRLHLYCTGTSRPGSPTVILEGGLGETSLTWSKVQPGVASFARVCSYDRAGYGWSDNGPQPRTDQRLVSELHTLLAKAGVPPPYILVGHSVGGIMMRLYAFTYPKQVAGLVLVDSAHEDQMRYPELRLDASQLSLCQAIAPFGIPRLIGLMNDDSATYPSTVQLAARAQFYQTRFCQTMLDEAMEWNESVAQVHASRHSLGRLPLVVLTQDGNGVPLSWFTLQKDLVSLSTTSTQVMATRSGHNIQLDQPDLVVAAVKRVLSSQV